MATEKAMGVELTEQAQLLRKLNFHGETIDSHVLHTYYLVAPDFFGAGSVIPLIDVNRAVVERALRIKKLSGDLCAMIGGRHTHPCALVVGGFSHTPTEDELRAMRDRLVAAREDMDASVELFASLDWPQFERETEYISLTKDDEYAFVGGRIKSTDGFEFPVEEYKSVTNENLVPFSSAKWTRHNRDSYMVGALARFNNNFDQLHPRARDASAKLGMEPIVTNPFLNSAAQVVEMVHCVEDGIEIIDELLERGVEPEYPVAANVKAGEGVASCDVPRGILFHHYAYDEEGCCKDANCIIPTNQNMANLNRDMQEFVPQIIDKPQDEVRLLLEMLVRAYDPCISCSAHFLTVEFV
jgi:coenzyme F420-reducing hydrogenase alpha subunit